jgi:hypothetical protein
MHSEREWAQAIVRDAASRYLASRRDRVDAFVDRHFSFAGTLRLHRRTIGWDLLRVPANLLLAPATFGLTVLGRIAARVGLAGAAVWLFRHRPTFETAMAREVSWLVTTELLQLPCVQPGRAHADDALLETILADPRLSARLDATEVLPADARERIAATVAHYAGTRAATAEIATGCFASSLGALWLKHATPGMITLGSVLAGTLAQQAAIAAFPLGAGLGAWWYSMYPVLPSVSLMAMTTGALVVLGALFAVFSAIVTDPLQRLARLHRRRLLRLIDALEGALCGDAAGSFPLRDHYVARLLDLLDLTAGVLRSVHT